MVKFKESHFLKFFVEHRTSANIIMLLMIIIGLLSIGKLNKQFFPDFNIEVVAVSVDWPGATAEEIDRNIISSIESGRFVNGPIVKEFSENLSDYLNVKNVITSLLNT